MTVKNWHSLSLITEILNRLCGVKIFLKLNLKDTYHRLRIRESDEWKTAFRTRYNHFEYLIMPFDLANVSATFQAYINRALVGLIDITCVIYLNDILIYSAEPAKYWRYIKQVLKRLRQFQLYINLKKYRFCTQLVEFLEFIVIINNVIMN